MKSRAFNTLYNHLSLTHKHTYICLETEKQEPGRRVEGGVCKMTATFIAHLLNSTESSGKPETMSF